MRSTEGSFKRIQVAEGKETKPCWIKMICDSNLKKNLKKEEKLIKNYVPE